MGRPINRWTYGEDNDIVSLACTLLLGIGRNHPFEQGNKRTALTAATVFLLFNGYSFIAPDGEPLAKFIEWSLTREISEGRFMKAMRECVMPTTEWDEYLRSRKPMV